MSVHLAIADLDNPKPEPFAVIAIDPSVKVDGGALAIVHSLHMTRADAERALEASSGVDCQLRRARAAAASVHPHSHNSALILDGRRDGTDIVQAALAGVVSADAELQERLHWREEAIRHAQGRFLNINIALSSGGTKREAIAIADVGEDCCKMALNRENLPARIVRQ